MDFSPGKGSLTTVHGVTPAKGMQLINTELDPGEGPSYETPHERVTRLG